MSHVLSTMTSAAVVEGGGYRPASGAAAAACRPRHRPRGPSQREALQPRAHVRAERRELVTEDGDAGGYRRVRAVLVAAVISRRRRVR
jgi:hypothetical protein